MENFGLIDLFSKLLSQKQLFEPKKDESVKKPVEPFKVAQLPSYYTQSSIILLIKKHEELSKQIDKDNIKK